MKKLKKIGIICLSSVFVFSFSSYLFGKDYINYNDNTNLESLDEWYNVVSDKPLILFKEIYITVTNHANNPGDVIIRLVNSKGNVIADEETITAGSKAEFLTFSGIQYTVQAKAISKTGQYKIAVKD